MDTSVGTFFGACVSYDAVRWCWPLMVVSSRQLYEAIRSGEALTDPTILSQFVLVTFADLKKYKFVYWFSFPALKEDGGCASCLWLAHVGGTGGVLAHLALFRSRQGWTRPAPLIRNGCRKSGLWAGCCEQLFSGESHQRISSNLMPWYLSFLQSSALYEAIAAFRSRYPAQAGYFLVVNLELVFPLSDWEAALGASKDGVDGVSTPGRRVFPRRAAFSTQGGCPCLPIGHVWLH